MATTTYWQDQARNLADYPKGNAWEQILRRALGRFPEKMTQFQDLAEMEAYILVKTAGALEHTQTLIDRGTDPQTANELGLDMLTADLREMEESQDEDQALSQ